MLTRSNVAKNNKTRFFYVLYSDKKWVFDRSERAQCPIYILVMVIGLSGVQFDLLSDE